MIDRNNDLSHYSITVGAASTEVSAPEDFAEFRTFLLLVNDSDEVIYVNVEGQPAVLHEGIRLNANGGSILFDSLVPSRGVSAICASGNKLLLVTRDPEST